MSLSDRSSRSKASLISSIGFLLSIYNGFEG